MGKATGFLEYERVVPGERPPHERIKDFDEFVAGMTEEQYRNQGARCMFCAVPFCHSGIEISGMASGCPLGNLVPEFNDLVYLGRWKDALRRLTRTNNFPEITGRVCPAPCEGSCTLGINSPSVTVKSIEAAIADRGFENGWILPEPPSERSGKKVCIVGSGPSGLACADQLNKAGHSVTVIERSDRPGGLLMYGIPNMKLDKKIISRRISLLKAEGITFITGVNAGVDADPFELLKKHDAVVLCCGASRPRDLEIPGRSLEGIHYAVDFLSSATKSILSPGIDNTNQISAKDRHVLVIGGGDTGNDCVATAVRQGCKSIVQLEIMPRFPDMRGKDNPWPEYPKVYKADYGQQEAAAVFGDDPREFLRSTKSFTGDGNGHVASAETVAVKWQRSENGRFLPMEIPDTGKSYHADLVMLAMGFTGPEPLLAEKLGLETDRRSNIMAEYGDFRTNIEKVFVAGDMRRGQSLVAWAINEGRGAARECDRFLSGKTWLP